MADWPPKNAKKAREEAAALRKVLRSEESTLEGVVNANKRAGAIIDRLQKGKVSDAEHVLIAELRKDRDDLHDRADAIRRSRERDREELERLIKWIEKHKPSSSFVVMGDSIDPSVIPTDIYGAAGYTAGFWPTWSKIKDGPWKGKLSISIRPGTDGRCIDVEAGDYTVAEGAASDAKVKYCSAATLAPLWNASEHPAESWYWTAHYLDHEHVCSPECGFGITEEMAERIVGTQWTSHGMGRNLDLSRVKKAIFN